MLIFFNTDVVFLAIKQSQRQTLQHRRLCSRKHPGQCILEKFCSWMHYTYGSNMFGWHQSSCISLKHEFPGWCFCWPGKLLKVTLSKITSHTHAYLFLAVFLFLLDSSELWLSVWSFKCRSGQVNMLYSVVKVVQCW